jgi:acetyl esterase/lipase
MKGFLQLLALLIFSLSCSNHDLSLIIPKSNIDLTENTLSYQNSLNNSYGSSPGQQYDIYLPSLRNTRNPVIVLLHGGGWNSGDKSALNFVVDVLKTKRVNCAIINTNYRLVNGASISYKQQLEDIDKLLKKVAKQSNELGISSKFLLVGMSAGGHLAMMYAQTADSDKLVTGVCGIAPPIDLTNKKIREGIIGVNIKQMIGKSFAEAPEEYQKASPFYQINRFGVPTIVFYGGKDAIVTSEQSEAYKKICLISYHNFEYLFFPDQTHDWSVWSETIDKMIQFAEKKLK